MGYVEVIKVEPHQLDICDQCGEQGYKESGEMIFDNFAQDILWFCFTCLQRKKLGIK